MLYREAKNTENEFRIWLGVRSQGTLADSKDKVATRLLCKAARPAWVTASHVATSLRVE